MENKSLLQRFLPHLLVLLLFLIITFLYFTPLLQGKTLFLQDMVQSQAAAKEVVDYHNKTGQWSLWTNSIYGGMPSYLIATDYPNSWSTKVGRFFTQLLPEPANMLFISLLGFYILLVTLRCNPWLAAVGAIAFSFCSYNFISIEAGHTSKVIAISYLSPIIAGVILAYRGKYWLGGALTALFLALQLYGNHVQITFYVFVALALFGVFELVYAIRQQELKRFAIATSVLAVAVLLSVGSHASRLMTTYEYSKETIRGKSELTKKQNTPAASGLDKEYAFQWSYGIGETFTLLIPNFYGGASGSELSTSSDSYKALLANGIQQGQARQFIAGAPTYWGEQPGTGGPAYAGAIVCFLFVLGLFIVKDRLKWWLLTVTVLFIMLAWGKNFAAFNYFVFDYIPGFNKFRAVTMILSVAQAFIALLALLAVKEIVQEKLTWASLKKPMMYSVGITAGFALLFALLGGVFFDFTASLDTQLPDWLQNAIRDDRQSMLQKDAFRSVFFILAAAALLWAFVQNKLKSGVLYGALLLLMWIDLFSVGKRYLNNDDFVSKRKAQQEIQPTEANNAILQDKALNFRVLDLTKGLNILKDATPAFFHKTVSGYHAARMMRFQELADSVLFPELQSFANEMNTAQNLTPAMLSKLNVLNMLNTRYMILAPAANGAVQNPYALGNAWFVKEYNLVADANAEIEAISAFNPAQTAVVDKRYQSLLNNLQIQGDSSASITLSAYAPDHLTYQTSASSPQLAVFSEMYYQGNNDWQAFVDGQAQPHFRANYVLRAMVVPAGKHTIEFRFIGETYKQGETIALICSILLFGSVGVAFYMENKKNRPQIMAKSPQTKVHK
ncbi:YfhO family protein [Rhodocytophaga rosea]|uniref:YfhO family protein n=1 Tax=Rhodocytophaga rosea TaxID=2704465 RepID=A0A6C0GQR4_9BACT|nr:YfhO family protein [Rhodocytophaga rosea]QHT70277.1 YfhO family protein [Rhodocytophaga rosea]